jgi:hypothetical protein
MKCKLSLVSTKRGLLQPLRGSTSTKAGQRVVESDLPDLFSCATPVVPELGGESQVKILLAQVVDGPDSILAHPRPRY